MRSGFRARLTTTVIGLVVITAAVVAATAYVLVRGSLRDQLREDALAVSEFAIVELATVEQLPADATRQVFEESGLAERLQRRGVTDVYVDFGDGDPYASRPEVLTAPGLLDPAVGDSVAAGQYGYQFLDVGGEARLVVAARRPVGAPDFYLFYDASVVEQALGDLWRFLLVGVAVVVALAVVVAAAVSRGVLRPVRTAGDAAERLAAGDLAARVPVASDDELGRMSAAFNTMAAALEGKIAELEAAEERERRFVADVSHELRTPLTGLWNEAQLLGSGLDRLEGPARRAAELLVADVDRLRRLVEELLEISRLDSGEGPGEPAPTDIQRFLSAVIAARLPAAELNVEPVTVDVDRRSLERVVGNLLDNAVAHAPGAAVGLTARVADGVLTLTVVDDGPGVPDEALEHLFDRFFKADRSRQGGSGLGLAIARRHAHLMGGELVAHRRNGGGLAFQLTVPVVTQLLHHGDGDETVESDDGAVDQERSAP